MKRREIIGLAATASIAPLSGCIGPLTGGDEEGYATLQNLALLHRTHRGDPPEVGVEVRIERADEEDLVHEQTYDVGEGEWVEIECVWPDAPLVVSVRLANEEEWSSRSTARDGWKDENVHFEFDVAAGYVSGPFFMFLEGGHPYARCHTDAGID